MMKFESNKFINIREIMEYLRPGVTTKLTQIHAGTGVTQLLFYVLFGKLKFLKSVSLEKKSSGF